MRECQLFKGIQQSPNIFPKGRMLRPWNLNLSQISKSPSKSISRQDQQSIIQLQCKLFFDQPKYIYARLTKLPTHKWIHEWTHTAITEIAICRGPSVSKHVFPMGVCHEAPSLDKQKPQHRHRSAGTSSSGRNCDAAANAPSLMTPHKIPFFFLFIFLPSLRFFNPPPQKGNPFYPLLCLRPC